jgi:hypothetical protein
VNSYLCMPQVTCNYRPKMWANSGHALLSRNELSTQSASAGLHLLRRPPSQLGTPGDADPDLLALTVVISSAIISSCWRWLSANQSRKDPGGGSGVGMRGGGPATGLAPYLSRLGNRNSM